MEALLSPKQLKKQLEMWDYIYALVATKNVAPEQVISVVIESKYFKKYSKCKLSMSIGYMRNDGKKRKMRFTDDSKIRPLVNVWRGIGWQNGLG